MSHIDEFFSVDTPNLETHTLDALKSCKKTLCTAESCTGGLIAKRITDVSGASSVFLGGVVTYTNEMKVKLLGVSAEALAAFGAVSDPVAAQMALGARARTGADIAISVTGVAGPDADDRGNAVGTIFVGIATADSTYVRPLKLSGTRDENRISASDNALDLVLRHLAGLPYEDVNK